MPRMPRGMFKREGRGYYTRKRVAGRDCWIALGVEYDEACAKLREVRRAGPVVAVRATVEEAAAKWLEKRVPLRRTAEGVQKAQGIVRMYLVPFMGSRRVGKVVGEDLAEYRRWVETRHAHLKPQSVWHILKDARCFFRWCQTSGLIERSPFPPDIMPKLEELPAKRLTDEEIAALVEVSEPYGFVLRLGLGTGLRWGELTRAQAADVDANGALVVSRTKARKLRRIPLGRALLAEVRQRIGRLVPFSEPGSFARMVRRYSGVRRFHPHMMRHTFACVWVDRGGNLAALQSLLGHASIKTTQRYARLSDDMVRAEVMRLDSVASRVAIEKASAEESVG